MNIPYSTSTAGQSREGELRKTLRGYGNAICPQAAAAFIEAFDEVTTCR
jgi:hypothetical protein